MYENETVMLPPGQPGWYPGYGGEAGPLPPPPASRRTLRGRQRRRREADTRRDDQPGAEPNDQPGAEPNDQQDIQRNARNNARRGSRRGAQPAISHNATSIQPIALSASESVDAEYQSLESEQTEDEVADSEMAVDDSDYSMILTPENANASPAEDEDASANEHATDDEYDVVTPETDTPPVSAVNARSALASAPSPRLLFLLAGRMRG